MRVVVGIDPAVSASETSNETGLVVVAKGADGHGYILADGSGRYSPHGWAERARWLKAQYHADCYVCEVNNGGNLVEATLRTVDRVGKIVKVHASHSKMTRAEPCAALYEQRRVHHADPHGDAFRVLEDQMTSFVQGMSVSREDVNRRGCTSPDRLDALVWAVHELFLSEQQSVDYSMFTAEAVDKLHRFFLRQGFRPEDWTPPGPRRW